MRGGSNDCALSAARSGVRDLPNAGQWDMQNPSAPPIKLAMIKGRIISNLIYGPDERRLVSAHGNSIGVLRDLSAPDPNTMPYDLIGDRGLIPCMQ